MQQFVVQHLSPKIRRIWRVDGIDAQREVPDFGLSDWARAQLLTEPRMLVDTVDEVLAGTGLEQSFACGRAADGSVTISGGLTDGERVYGAYDADATSLERRGSHIHLTNELHMRGRHETAAGCDLCTDHDPDVLGYSAELHMPVFFTSAGYGVYIANATAGAVLDLGHRQPDRWTFTAPGGDADLYLFGPGTPSELVQLQSQLTGQQPLPPTWALGYLQSRFGYESFDHVRAVLDRFEQERLPVHGLVFDVHWLEEFVNLRWHPTYFPNPEDHLADMARRGVRSVVITEPGTRTDASNFPEGEAGGHFATDAAGELYDSGQWYAARGFDGFREHVPSQGALLNVFSESAGDWWYSQHLPLLHQGVDTWWLDLNEPEDIRDDIVFPTVDWPEPFSGGTGAQLRNVYALAQQRLFATRDLQHSDRRPFMLSRSGTVGSQRYGASPWSGDIGASWDELRTQPHLAMSAGLCCMPLWGCDVGGFHGDPAPELFARWMQLGAFVPVYRAHGALADREPWSQGSEACEWIRPALTLRAQLLPSIVTWTRNALRNGLPLVRPIMLDDPTDERWWNCNDQWMFGPLLVAPVMHEGARSRQVALPKGAWVDLWTGCEHEGGTTIEVDAPMEHVPVFVPRTTALVVDSNPLAGRGHAWPPDDVDVWSFARPGEVATTALYVDDGSTRAYESGEFCDLAIAVTDGDVDIVVRDGRMAPPGIRPASPAPGVVSDAALR